jgi:hypothetical protein
MARLVRATHELRAAEDAVAASLIFLPYQVSMGRPPILTGNSQHARCACWAGR